VVPAGDVRGCHAYQPRIPVKALSVQSVQSVFFRISICQSQPERLLPAQARAARFKALTSGDTDLTD
jgi:hypothetical protein